MSQTEVALPLPDVLHVRDTCLCFATQRAARRLARRFDAAFRPLGITNTQFSLMMPLNAPRAPSLGQLSDFLGIDQTTMSAALRALERAGLAQVSADAEDKRIRRPALTARGLQTLKAALPIWRAEHARLETELEGQGPVIRTSLQRLSAAPPQKENPDGPTCS